MCGIAGVASTDPEARRTGVVTAMLSWLTHRGPDDEGIASVGDAVIGARRLSIIDLTRGHQPMANEDGDIVAVQNGEIYNFEELRAELVRSGHVFKTRNDTEILPHAYEEWGTAFVPRLRGMFALALWDQRRRRLVLSRDRFGKKPLVFAHLASTVVFGSEIQAVLRHPMVPRDVDDAALREYLRYGYVPAPRTAFAVIRKLPPASTLVFEDGRLEIERYWSFSFGPKLRISFDEAASEVRRLLDDAVKVRLMSDVPLGVFLSGGLDSSAVVAFMAAHSATAVKTFSIGFADRSYDELPHARVVARTFGTDHHELVVDPADVSVLPMLARHVGEPFADSSIVPTFHVARMTRRDVTVALTGDGGDEVFGGYDRYRAAAIGGLIPGPFAGVAAAIGRRLPHDERAPRQLARAHRLIGALSLRAEERYLHWTGYFTGELLERIAGDRLAAAVPDDRLRDAATLTGAAGDVETYMAGDTLLHLPGDLLVKMDIATMAASLEARAPLLDHQLAEFVARLPSGWKVSPVRTKILMRRAMAGILPESILARSKMGFTAPVRDWLRGPLRMMFSDLALSSRAAARGIVSPSGVRALFEEHTSGRTDRTRHLWSLLMLELWFREVVEAPPTPS